MFGLSPKAAMNPHRSNGSSCIARYPYGPLGRSGDGVA